MVTPSAAARRTRRAALVLAGGNALGAYTAGTYEAMQAHGFERDLISGCSISAVMGAIIAGNPPDLRVGKLREFCAQAAFGSSSWVPTGAPSRRIAKILGFLRASVDERSRPGMADMERALTRLRSGDYDASSAGCTFYDTRVTALPAG